MRGARRSRKCKFKLELEFERQFDFQNISARLERKRFKYQEARRAGLKKSMIPERYKGWRQV